MSTAYIKNLIDYNGDIIYPQTKAITDIKANAKGFRRVGVAKWQKN